MPLVVWVGSAGLNEYFKVPAFANLNGAFFFIVLVGIVIVFTAYLLLYLTKKVFEMFKVRKYGEEEYE
jgi:hypothetical protein